MKYLIAVAAAVLVLNEVNADALIHRLSVSNGRISTSTGMSYRVLVLDPRSQQMSLAVLRKIRDLVQGGSRGGGTKANRIAQFE